MNHKYWDTRYQRAKLAFFVLLILEIATAIAVIYLWFHTSETCLLSAQYDDGSWAKEVSCK